MPVSLVSVDDLGTVVEYVPVNLDESLPSSIATPSIINQHEIIHPSSEPEGWVRASGNDTPNIPHDILVTYRRDVNQFIPVSEKCVDLLARHLRPVWTEAIWPAARIDIRRA